MNAAFAYPAAGNPRAFHLARLILLILACTLLLAACTPITPPATVERVSDYDISHSVGGAQSYNLSPRERAIYKKKAASGDIVAAKTLLEYYEMVAVDEKQYQHWLRVVERLQMAGAHQPNQSSK